MAINFPDSPSNGDTHTAGGKTFTYDSTVGAWSPAPAGATTFIGLTDTPSSFGTASQIPAINSGANALEFIALPSSVTVYATIDLLPLSGNSAGDQALVTATNRLYIWNGSGWYNIALINTTPSISGVNSSYDLAIDGTATVITITATDPEGLPITYSIASDTSGDIATVTQGTGANTNIFTITPSTNDANAGTFSLTFRASDGVNIASSIASFELAFSVVNSNYTTALITSVGANNAVNNTFVDSSSANYTLTAAGNPTQSTFSPYRDGGYSYYWDGSGTDYFQILSPTAALDFGTGDFTIEMWIWLNDLSAGIAIVDTRPSETNGNQYFYFSILTDGNFKLGSNNVDRIITTGGPITVGSWHHIALQRNNGTLEAYVDGSRNATASFTQSLDANRWSLFKNSFASGGVADAGGGYIKDYRVVKGTAVYSGATYDVPTEPLTAISGTSFLLFSSRPTFTYDAVGIETITWTNGESAPFSPYDYLKYSSATNGGSMYFDGNGDYLSLTASGDLQAMGRTGTECTVEAWVYIRSVSSSGVAIYSQGTAGSVSGNNIISFEIRSNRTLRALINGAYQNETGCPSSTTALSLNTWYHIAYVLYNQVWTIYINGKADGSTGTGSYPSGTNHSSAFINRVYYDTGRIADSNIADLRIDPTTALYTSDFTPPTAPISASTGTQLFLNASNIGIIDKSQSCQTITLAGNTKSSTTQSKYLTSSIYVDGTGDYILLDDSGDLHDMFAADFTIEGWYYPSATPANSVTAVFSKRANGSVVGGVLLYFAGANTTPSLLVDTGGSWGIASACSSGFTVGQWNHFAVTRNGSAFKVFIDGSSVLSVSSSATIPNNTSKFGIGTMGNDGSYAMPEAYFSDVRITKGLARYTANFTPPAAALKG